MACSILWYLLIFKDSKTMFNLPSRDRLPSPPRPPTALSVTRIPLFTRYVHTIGHQGPCQRAPPPQAERRRGREESCGAPLRVGPGQPSRPTGGAQAGTAGRRPQFDAARLRLAVRFDP